MITITRKLSIRIVAVIIIFAMLTGCAGPHSDSPASTAQTDVSEQISQSPSESEQTGQQPDTMEQTGQIYLYGEAHAVEAILDREFELWDAYYHENGMRHLFVELPYYTAEFLNLWMKSGNDDILEQLCQDWEGSSEHDESNLNFYRKIKEACPETVFHGTDVGHQYATTGARYLAYLISVGQEDSEAYRLTEEAIEQGKHYYLPPNNVYRENTMVENFIREFDSLEGMDIMGIYGNAHTYTDAMDWATHTVPCMANQLKERYGDALHTRDLTLPSLLWKPYRTDTIQIGEKTYTASYFGQVDMSSWSQDYQYREFWRLEDAYDDFKDAPTNGQVLPYNNYPMEMAEGQVFVIDYTKPDGTVERKYYRSDGDIWQGLVTTVEFTLDKTLPG